MTSAKDEDPPRWQVFGERTVYDSPWVRVVRVDVQPPAGDRFEHHVLRLQRVVMALVLSEDRSSVLMLRRHRFVTDEIGWELPGGIVDAGESGLEAAARETLEETGYEASAGRLLAAFQPMIGMVDARTRSTCSKSRSSSARPPTQSKPARSAGCPSLTS